jgi:hypothetical protein
MSVENVGYGMLSPPGFVNSLTPGSATVTCGCTFQSLVFTSTPGDPVYVAFDQPASWNTNAWTPDASGGTWTCQVGGIYQMAISQSLTVFNAADIVNPVVDVVMNMIDDNHPDLNQTVANTITVPITTDAISIQTSVSGLVCCAPGTRMTCTLVSPSGGITITSEAYLPYTVAFTFNLVAQGPFGEASIL